MPSQKEIAKAAGVSTAVVSRVMSGDRSLRISEETRARVLEVIARLDYTPHPIAQSLRSATSRLIALIVHDISNPLYGEIIRAAQTAAAAHGKALLVGDARTIAESSSHLVNLIRAGGVDGLILQGAGMATDIALEQAARRNVRTILLQVSVGACGVLRLPDAAAARLATEHLLDLGHERIGCLAPKRDLAFSIDRVAGWRSALEARGVDASDHRLAWAGSDLASGHDGAARLLARFEEITALVACNPIAAIGAMRALRESGRSIPEDVSMIALHDLPLLDYLDPPLTAVKLPIAEMGAEAVHLLCSDVELANVSRQVTGAPPAVVFRHSTTPL